MAQKQIRYREASTPRSVFQIAFTLGPFVLVWATMRVALHLEQFWLYALLLLPAAGLLVRLFMIEHDCGHGSFSSSKTGNAWIGRAISILTLTPYDYWRRGHAAGPSRASRYRAHHLAAKRSSTQSDAMCRMEGARFVL